MIDYPAMMQRKNKARSTTSVSSLSGHGSGYDTTNDDDDGNKKSDRGIGGGNNDDGGGGGGGGGGGRLRSSMIIANGNAAVVGGDAGGLLLELTSPATTTSTTIDISPPPPNAQRLTTTNKAGGSGGGGGGGGGGVAVVLSATVKRNKCGTRPFDARWLNLDCCGLVCAGVTYALHAYGLYAFCFVLLPPWLSETDEDGYREVSERGEVLGEVREEEMKGGREREILFVYFSSLFSLSLSSVSCYRRMCMFVTPCFRFYPTPANAYIIYLPSHRSHDALPRQNAHMNKSNERTNE
jgi:hypothetical protein